jgi:homopolymeric O-antigen transport system permease protein
MVILAAKVGISMSHMPRNLRRLIQARDLLTQWTLRIVRGRYQQSLLGGLWAVVQPAATVAIFSIVFTRFVRIDTGGVPYVLFSFATMVPWTLFSTSLTDMVNSLVDNMNLVTKIYFPREVLPIAATLARLLDFAIAAVVLLVVMIYFRVPLFGTTWLFLPIIIATQVALALGLGFAGATLNVFFRDAKHLVTLGLQIWLYASPVIYPVSSVPVQLRPLYFLNPMAGVVEAYRSVLLYGKWPDLYLAWAAFVALAALVVGYWFFKRLELQFADVV